MKDGCSCDRPMRVRRALMIMENEMTDVVTRIVNSPIGEVVQVYDRDTSMYLGNIVVDDDWYICTRVDAHDCDVLDWHTQSYGCAKAFIAHAIDGAFVARAIG